MMSPHGENKPISLLTEIHSDIRQIKTDLQSVVTALKEQQQKQIPASSPSSDDTLRIQLRAPGRARLRTSFAICGKREVRMTEE